MWNKVNIKKTNKNLPPVGTKVLWATNEGIADKKTFIQFIGELAIDEKHVEHADIYRKLTSNYWWQKLPDNPILD